MPTKERLEKDRARRAPLPENVASFINIVNNERHTFAGSFVSLEEYRFSHPLMPVNEVQSLTPIQFDAGQHQLHAEVRTAAIQIADAFVAAAARGEEIPKVIRMFGQPFPKADLLKQIRTSLPADTEGWIESVHQPDFHIKESASTAVEALFDAGITLVITGSYRWLHRCGHCSKLFPQKSDSQQHCEEACRQAAYRHRRRELPSKG